MSKYIFVTGGVVSSLGKGVSSSSIGALLRARGHRVTAVKIDPYINLDAGTMRPYEHGEVFVTKDGAETDLDIGTYERFLDIDLAKGNNITTGQVYKSVIEKERRGEYLSQTVQVIPHITDEIQERIRASAKAVNADIVLVEVGGTVGDIESLPFLEAIRQMRFNQGRENTLYLHVTLLPYLETSEEFKTKPTQHSVATLRSVGIQPDGLIIRSDRPMPEELGRKIALFTNVEPRDVFNSYNAEHIYAVPEILEQQGIGRFIEKQLHLEKVTPNIHSWHEAMRILKQPDRVANIAIVGKYVAMPDAYISVMEALNHAGIAYKSRVDVTWISSEDLVDQDVEGLADYDGILVPGGFGVRGIEGKIRAASFAREHHIPYLGLCLGLQVAVIEYARHVLGLNSANSTEFDRYTHDPVIDLMPEQLEVSGMGGTMRLGDWPMKITPNTRLESIYEPKGEDKIVFERHRHRYEVNPNYVERLKAAGLVISGVTPGMLGRGEGLVEAVEVSDHPFFVAVQSHPELKSRLSHPSPPFKAFIGAALERQAARNRQNLDQVLA
ncbi:MAG: CTP synthase [Deinococcales bacterium]